MCIFLSLPIAERLYKWLYPIIGNGKASIYDGDYVPEDDDDDESSDKLSIGKLKRWIVLLLAFSVIVAIGNVVGYHTSFVDSFIAMLIISAITIIGMALERVFPVHIPSIIFISLIGLILAIPGMPTSDFLGHYISQIELTTIVKI